MSDLDAHRLSADSLAAGDPTGWFERLYAEAARGAAVVPWAKEEPRDLLVDWVGARAPRGAGRRAVVVGCGFGHDAEYVASLGFRTVGFDISETAMRSARERFPDSAVEYVAADLLDLPGDWIGAFDLVVEIFTAQALPEPPRRAAIEQIPRLLAPGGTLIVISSAHDPSEPDDGLPPWPLTQEEIDAFAIDGVAPVAIERLDGFWRVEHRRRAA